MNRIAANEKDWVDKIEDRKKKELEFFNMFYNKEIEESLSEADYKMRYGYRKFYSIARPVTDFTLKWIAEKVPGKIFLDYACGSGKFAIHAAKNGAALSVGIDISSHAIEVARKEAENEKVSDKCIFLQADCEKTGFPNDCIDIVLCGGMLHHLDLNFALPELQRIMKNGGILLAVEALNYNPIFKIYRKSTPGMRSEFEVEHILSMKEVRFAKKFFNLGKMRFWFLTVLVAAFFHKTKIFKGLRFIFRQLDSILLRIPGLRLMAWQFTFELIKTGNAKHLKST